MTTQQVAWIESIRDLMANTPSTSSAWSHASSALPWRLFKVPAPQREAEYNWGAFDPYVFSFGPFHARFDDGLTVADRYKVQAARALLSTEQYEKLVEKIEGERDAILRAIYGGEHEAAIAEISPRALASLLALDSLTILAASLTPQLFHESPVASVFWKDVILVENQIPLFLFWEALVAEQGQQLGVKPVDQVLQDFVMWHVYAASPFHCEHLSLPPRDDYLYQSLLGCIYEALTSGATSNPSSNTTMIPTATHLQNSGIRIRSSPGVFNSICFDNKNKCLVLPRILVAHDTKRLLLNLLAFEATSRFPANCSITSYVTFMDCLIDTDSDVAILVEADVLENHMGSHAELAAMWNNLRVGVPTLFTEHDAEIVKQVHGARKLRWRKWVFAFLDTYWHRKPWLVFSIFLATAFFVFSFLQTVWTIQFH